MGMATLTLSTSDHLAEISPNLITLGSACLQVLVPKIKRKQSNYVFKLKVETATWSLI